MIPITFLMVKINFNVILNYLMNDLLCKKVNYLCKIEQIASIPPYLFFALLKKNFVSSHQLKTCSKTNS